MKTVARTPVDEKATHGRQTCFFVHGAIFSAFLKVELSVPAPFVLNVALTPKAVEIARAVDCCSGSTGIVMPCCTSTKLVDGDGTCNFGSVTVPGPVAWTVPCTNGVYEVKLIGDVVDRSKHSHFGMNEGSELLSPIK